MRSRNASGALKLLSASIFMICVAFVSPASAENPELQVTVMTRNMYTGADFGAVAAATNEPEFRSAVLTTIEHVLQSRIPDRAARIADEIAAAQPELVALQEASVWKIQTESGPIVLDQLELLLASLEILGLHYRAAAVHTLTTVEIENAVTYSDRDVILARSDLPPGHLKILGTETHLYDELLKFPALDAEIDILRGWMAVDVKIRGARFKFVNTHLEAPLPGKPGTQDLQVAQAVQLVEDLKATTLPVILAGDFNSDAEPTQYYPPDATPSYGLIAASGYVDVWEQLSSDDPGFTWPLMSETGEPETPLERIDLIFTKGPWALSIVKTGETPAADGLFASDHAGMVAALSLENHRPEKDNPSTVHTRAHHRNQKQHRLLPVK